MAKATRKRVVSRAASKKICGRVTPRILKEHRGRKQRRCGRKRGGVEAEKGSGWRRPIRGFLASTYGLESGKQKCLKAEYGAMRHGRRDRAKKEK